MASWGRLTADPADLLLALLLRAPGSLMTTAGNNPFRIWVDADACPAPIKEILYRTGARPVTGGADVQFANESMHVPSSQLIRLITVPEGADLADDKIVEMLAAGDVVITGDIPLAARVVDKSAIAIGVRGELFDENSVHDRGSLTRLDGAIPIGRV